MVGVSNEEIGGIQTLEKFSSLQGALWKIRGAASLWRGKDLQCTKTLLARWVPPLLGTLSLLPGTRTTANQVRHPFLRVPSAVCGSDGTVIKQLFST